MAALAGDQAVECAIGEGGRAFEHHVFHPVRNAGNARNLLAAAHPVPDHKTSDGRVVHFFENDG